MIDAYNRSQVYRGMTAFVLGSLALLMTAVFFHWVSHQVLERLVAVGNASFAAWVAAVALTGCVFLIGYLRGKRGGGHYAYEESGLNLQVEPTSGGNFMMQRYAHQTTVPVYLLGQVFLAAPLQFLKGVRCFRQRIPCHHGLEQRLTTLLGEIQASRKWLPVAQFDDRQQDLRLLIQMNEVEFSPRKGVVRARSD